MPDQKWYLTVKGSGSWCPGRDMPVYRGGEPPREVSAAIAELAMREDYDWLLVSTRPIPQDEHVSSHELKLEDFRMAQAQASAANLGRHEPEAPAAEPETPEDPEKLDASGSEAEVAPAPAPRDQTKPHECPEDGCDFSTASAPALKRHATMNHAGGGDS